MIFSIYYLLCISGYSACSTLLGGYMIRYTGASSLELGLVFMLQPLAVFCRLPLCALADRYQNHKQLLCRFLLWTSLSYVPMLILPFFLHNNPTTVTERTFLTPRVCFWICVISHLSGSLAFCGAKSLGDALSVNYAKRVGSDYSAYRKYGSISYGISGFFLGMINENWIVPDFVPSMTMYVSTLFILSILIYIWPSEYFIIVPEQLTHEKQIVVPTGRALLRSIGANIRSIFSCNSSEVMEVEQHDNKKKLELPNERVKSCLTVRQQMSIYLLLLRRDLRIPAYLFAIFFAGVIGYAPQNFIFTYMGIVCDMRKTCDAAHLTGMVMLTYCIVETTCYLIINHFKEKLDYSILIALTMASITVHYLFYGFMLDKVSPYFFLLEALHGFEYSGCQCSCLALGYKFANEVELLIPELIQRGIISKNDDFELVKVSLVATMSGSFTLAYDGFGTILGALLFGLITDKYSYTSTWFVVGSMGLVGFVSISVSLIISKCMDYKPQVAVKSQNNLSIYN